MERILSGLVVFCCCLLAPRAIMAWNDVGHMTIAAEAYQQLSPEVKAQVFEVLKSHPDFAAWQASYHPNPTLDLPATVFLRCSTWPDEIRGQTNIYDHPFWHFIDYPLRPPGFAFEPDERPTNNVLYGIAQCEAALDDTNASAELRAVSLSYLVHLVGDMHQPLHCESWYDAVYTNGDRGGNDVYVRTTNAATRLHALWDDLVGTTPDRRQQWHDATANLAKFPRRSLPELAADTTPLSWSLESRKLAITYGYLNGNLKGGTNFDTAPALPAGYVATATTVAERQVALAGDRLADTIQTHLQWGRDLPFLPDNTNTVDVMASVRTSVDEASKYYDEKLTVTGKVVRVTVNPNIVLIRFEQAAGAIPFTAAIFREHAGPFGDLEKLNGQKLELTGTVTEYRGRPEMILESTNQVRVVGEE